MPAVGKIQHCRGWGELFLSRAINHSLIRKSDCLLAPLLSAACVLPLVLVSAFHRLGTVDCAAHSGTCPCNPHVFVVEHEIHPSKRQVVAAAFGDDWEQTPSACINVACVGHLLAAPPGVVQKTKCGGASNETDRSRVPPGVWGRP